MKNLGRLFQAPISVLIIGIVTRCLVYLFLDPDNGDRHSTILEYLVKHKTFPSIMENSLAFHPPLYYWMAAPILAVTGSNKAVQFLSLILSIGTLIVLYRIIYKTELIVWPRARLYSLWLACLLPEFVMFGLYISNDTLSFFLGSLTILQVSNYLKAPGWKQGALLAVLTGLGLLTKSNFLVFLPVLLVFILFVQFRQHGSLGKAAWAAAAFVMISGVLGSYKYVDNYVRYHNVFINSLDTPEYANVEYRPGLRPYVDFNLLRLMASPSLQPGQYNLSSPTTTIGSYPLLLYGTFWFQHIPESNFTGAAHKPFSYIGSVIFAVAVVPDIGFRGWIARTRGPAAAVCENI